MPPVRIFISGVQAEFAEERTRLRDFLQSDPTMRRFFEVFLFEDLPAKNRRPDQVYREEAGKSHVYVGLLGLEYGSEDEEGISPTEREFDCATAAGAHRLIFVKGGEASRSAKMQSLIDRAQSGLIRKRFSTTAELLVGVYGALVDFLRENGLVHWGPFDTSPCVRATLDDLDRDRMRQFVREARAARKFPLDEDIPSERLLEHLNMIREGQLSNAAVLLFGKRPQQFILSSEVRCAHFHGTEAAKPIPSYQVYEGTVFAVVDAAVDFVLSKINLRVGTRAESNQAPRTYEIPPEVVSEAIVNAVAHRDYTHSGCVQVMLFADRLEILNPGCLLPPLTIDALGTNSRSFPPNPLLTNGMYLNKYIERMGTGVTDMIRRCAEAGLPGPEFSADGGFSATIRRQAGMRDSPKESAKNAARRTSPPNETKSKKRSVKPRFGGETGASDSIDKAELTILHACSQESVTRKDIALAVDFDTRRLNRRLHALLTKELLEMTEPNKPRSPTQRYRLTAKGLAAISAIEKKS